MPLPKLQIEWTKDAYSFTSFKGLIGLKMLLKKTDKGYPPPIIIWKSNWDRSLWPGSPIPALSQNLLNDHDLRIFRRDLIETNWSHFHFGWKLYVVRVLEHDDHDADLASWLKLYGVICLGNAVVWGKSNKSKYGRLAASGWYFWKIMGSNNSSKSIYHL